MNLIWAAAMAAGAFVGTALAAVLSDMISEEVRSRLDSLPRSLVRLAARILPPQQRRAYEGEWIAELNELLHGAEARPITRLLRGGWFAAGLLRGAWYVRAEYAPSQLRIKRTIRRWSFALSLFVLISVSAPFAGRYLFRQILELDPTPLVMFAFPALIVSLISSSMSLISALSARMYNHAYRRASEPTQA